MPPTPPPCSIDARRETEPAQAVQHVHAGKARADDDHVVGFRGFAGPDSIALATSVGAPSLFSVVVRQHSHRLAKAQEANRRALLCLFCAAEWLIRRVASARKMRGQIRLGIAGDDGLASKRLRSSKATTATRRLPGESHEIADLRHAGHRVPAARLQPLPRRRCRRQPRRRLWRARRHRAHARHARTRAEMDRRRTSTASPTASTC